MATAATPSQQVVVDITKSFGSCLIGSWLSCIIYGASTLQVYVLIPVSRTSELTLFVSYIYFIKLVISLSRLALDLILCNSFGDHDPLQLQLLVNILFWHWKSFEIVFSLFSRFLWCGTSCGSELIKPSLRSIGFWIQAIKFLNSKAVSNSSITGQCQHTYRDVKTGALLLPSMAMLWDSPGLNRKCSSSYLTLAYSLEQGTYGESSESWLFFN